LHKWYGNDFAYGGTTGPDWGQYFPG
jgi:hypothetical protein